MTLRPTSEALGTDGPVPNQTPARTLYRVFISHGTADTPVAERLIAPALVAAGAEVFIDRGKIEYGTDFRASVFEELARTDELCVLLTSTSVTRPWVFAEIGVAIHRQLRIVAIIYGVPDDELRSKGVTSLLGTHLTLLLDDLDTYVEQLRKRIKSKHHV